MVDGEVSNWKSVLSGVPQGSVGEVGACPHAEACPHTLLFAHRVTSG